MDIIENHSDYQEQYTVKPLWNPKYFFILTLIFTYIPISIFYIWNFIRLKKKIWNQSIIIILAATCLTVISIFFISNEFIAKVIGMTMSFGLGQYMKVTQEPLYKEHIERGGKSASYILPTIISIVFTIAFVAVMIWSFSITKNIPENYKVYLDDEIYYTEHVKSEEVDRLGEFLIEEGFFFEDNATVAVKLDYENNIYHVSIMIDEEYYDDQEVNDALRYLWYRLTEDVFDGDPVRIHITDDLFNIIKTINESMM
ncbi:hypothetical protein [Vallitalea okinawensis]|uniref:hypothetical protein n=1 Tax=Vallitalea okinawensis TaxID=2078660 RepID=UPI000CFDC513|nr:hypothetical protein [Vallitalea okinawensis]